VIDEAARVNAGARPLGSVGVVVGATIGRADQRGTGGSDEIDVGRLNGPVLAPGVGAQGGTADGLARIFEGLDGVVLPSSSREILRHGPDLHTLREAAKRSLGEYRKVR
jgi:orotidine-5'-phosphate decarboxylase